MTHSFTQVSMYLLYIYYMLLLLLPNIETLVPLSLSLWANISFLYQKQIIFLNLQDYSKYYYLNDLISSTMSCNGCRVLRKGCSENCILRPCIQWIESPEAQGHATVFVAKFFGRAGLMSFISAVPESQCPGT